MFVDIKIWIFGVVVSEMICGSGTGDSEESIFRNFYQFFVKLRGFKDDKNHDQVESDF